MIFHANITQTESGTMFGRQIASGGDINGDGFLDMVVSNTGTTESPTGYSSIEFFYGIEGLQVNEVAPRTHNSAHFSIPSSVSDKIASTGHSGSQTPQSIHSSG